MESAIWHDIIEFSENYETLEIDIRSPHTRQAIINLINAIELDNIENPQPQQRWNNDDNKI